MKTTSHNVIIIIKIFIFFLLLIHSIITVIFSDKALFLSYLSIFAALYLFIDFFINLVMSKNRRYFILDTEYGQLQISEVVIDNIIALIMRKYKIVKNYITKIYNNNNGQLVIDIEINTNLKKDDILPTIIETMKSNIIESINNTVAITKTDSVNIKIEKIKRIQI